MTLTPETHNTPEAMDAFWASVDDGYFADRAWMYEFVVATLDRYLADPDYRTHIVDYGCGCGHVLAMIKAKHLAVKVTGYDYSPVAVRLTNARLKGQGWAFAYIWDVTEWEVRHTDQYDLGLCIQTLEHIQDYYKALGEMMRNIKPGGSLILTVPNNDQWPGHFNHWTPESFRELLETYGEVAECMTFGRNTGDETNILARVVKV